MPLRPSLHSAALEVFVYRIVAAKLHISLAFCMEAISWARDVIVTLRALRQEGEGTKLSLRVEPVWHPDSDACREEMSHASKHRANTASCLQVESSAFLTEHAGYTIACVCVCVTCVCVCVTV